MAVAVLLGWVCTARRMEVIGNELYDRLLACRGSVMRRLLQGAFVLDGNDRLTVCRTSRGQEERRG